MVLLFHATFGAIWGVFIHNVYFAFILGFATHYLLDKLPHWEYDVKDLKKFTFKGIFTDLSKLILDFTLGIVLVLFFNNHPDSLKYTIAGAAGGLAPDFFLFVSLLLIAIKSNGPFGKSAKIFYSHHLNNHFNITKKTPIWIGALSCAVVLVSSLLILRLL
ncbi:MAG: hypothetical protein COU81_03810 [Candidatus Portnoybacteria bacterium CG10_big_fil_rev_8_21_14_0_10_36_7]|uniref:DUF3307 domain-containing protein n=1 Tax=Candidatus Portnoybacteria bacterium CG10_big_fil_rev_8_21_14_0_10_36_7 TaxID=1974812 RepID=A0A2M8KD90_9BACT|nr:MAG: hypothetical protein COU81_03810 [Candidatus Portnoybacteria bacterium CG10_big_fil_rev_8_21_14_0_10_36_7]